MVLLMRVMNKSFGKRSILALFVFGIAFIMLMPVMAITQSSPVTSPISPVVPSVTAPYIASNSAGTYVVESNGTYLWNGHYLRAPPVPYPKVPTIAPDGLPYGAVGPVGAQGHVGPYSFTKGTAKIVGVSPTTTTGTNTVINANTYWNNETISLVGNVTIDAGFALTINTSVVTFTEPASTVLYAYGFNLSAGTAASKAKLIIQQGSTITQSSSVDNEWFIFAGNNTYVAPAKRGWVSIASNATIDTLGSANVPAKNYSENIYFTDFNYSQYNGYGYNLLTDALNASYSTHSFFNNGSTAVIDDGNDTFNNTMAGLIVPFPNGYAGTQAAWNTTDSLFVNYSTFENMGLHGIAQNIYEEMMNGIFINNFAGPMNAMAPMTLIFTHNLVENLNLTQSALTWTKNDLQPFPNIYDGGYENISNNSIEHIFLTPKSGSYNSANPLIGGEARYAFASQPPQWNTNTFVSNIKHNTLINETVGGSVGVGGSNVFGSGLWSTNAEYNLLNGLHNLGNSEFAMSIFAQNINLSFNKFENFQNTFLPVGSKTVQPNYPYFSSYDMNDNDLGIQTYTWGGAYLNSSSTAVAEWKNVGTLGRIDQQRGNYFVNFTNNALGQQGNGYLINFNNNTLINFSASAGIAPANGEYAWFPIITNNRAYGFYNYSAFFGEFEGGVFGGHYGNNTVNDLGAHSWLYFGQTSNDNLYNTNGPILLGNANGTFLGKHNNLLAHENLTSDFTISNSSITNVTMGAYVPGSGNFNRNVLPTDFNITLYDSYVPAVWRQWMQSSNTYTALNWFALHGGTTYNVSHQNPSFLNLTGYLGVYTGQTYTINTSNIKGESSLPIMWNGEHVATISQNTGNYIENLTVNSASSYSVGASSSKAPGVNLEFNMPPGKYVVKMYSNSGTFIQNISGVFEGNITVLYNPVWMPLDPIFSAVAVSSQSHKSPPPSPSLPPIHHTSFLIYLLPIGVVIVLIMMIFIGKKPSGGHPGERRIKYISSPYSYKLQSNTRRTMFG